MATRLVALRNVEAPTGALSPEEPPIRDICRVLEHEYGSPRHGNPDDPLDDLVYIIISTRSHERRFGETYRQIKTAFPRWDDLADERLPELEALLIPGGLGRLKARQIESIIRRLRADFGHATLSPLQSMSNDEAEAYLTSLWGVSLKVAKCVAMYALGRQVLPVDVHVHRVAGRLGFRVKKRPDTSQDWIEEAVPPDLRYGFHVNAIAHGRAVCRPRDPKCDECCVASWCRYHRELSERG
jgi:endonuclease III